jgi:hypothetical protein
MFARTVLLWMALGRALAMRRDACELDGLRGARTNLEFSFVRNGFDTMTSWKGFGGFGRRFRGLIK